jgi:hypothetical protein
MAVRALIPTAHEPSALLSCGELAERWLAEAYELVSSGWCAGMAQDAVGGPCEPAAPIAARWSASGALAAAWQRSGVDEVLALEALQRANLALTAVVNDVPQAWNDAFGRRQHEVAEALLHAVSLVNDPALFGPSRRGEVADADPVGEAA